MKPIVRSYLAEVNLGTTAPSAGQNINIQDYPQLRDVIITGVQVFNASSVAVSPQGKAVVTTLTGITLTLMDKFNMEMLYQYPAQDLNPVAVAGFYRDIVPFELQLTKSYISVLSATNLLANQSVCLNFFYVPKKDWKKYSAMYVRK
jgi:hypothetical protein